MMDWLSLRVKLTLGYITVFALTMVLGGLGVYLAIERELSRSMDNTLHEIASIAQGSVENDQGRSYFAPDLRPPREVSIELLSASGQVLSRSGQQDSGSGQVVAPRPGLITVRQQRVLTTALPEGLFLRVSRPTETLSEFLETLARVLVIAGSLMISVACAAGHGLARRALKPVAAVARTAQSIAERGNYQERVPQAPGQDEMARLTGTVNSMLDRLSDTIEHEKQFARIAAHELRTPLTVLKGRLDLTLDRPRSAADYEHALRGMRGRVDALTGLSESLLALARTDAPVTLERVELASAALKVSESLEDTARALGKRVRFDVKETWVLAEQGGVERVISNLLDNALKYGVGPDVTLTTGANSLSIENLGSGPSPDQWGRLLQPFERGADGPGVSGTGLGLALVAALTRRWPAAMVPKWEAGRFRVELQFTAAEG